MQRFAQDLSLSGLGDRSCHSYYRQIRLISKHFDHVDPASLNEDRVRSYIIHLKSVKQWSPRTLRIFLAAGKLFFAQMLSHTTWKVFDLAKAKDVPYLPEVLSRLEVAALLKSIRKGRFLTPIKLLYVCGLRLQEALTLAPDDIRGSENRLLVRCGKPHSFINRGKNPKKIVAGAFGIRLIWNLPKHQTLQPKSHLQ